MDSTPSPLDPELLLAHAGFVRSVARSLLRDGSAVDDVVQQTWLTALEKPPRDAGALRRWLARVVRSVARESRRADERRVLREAASAPSEVDPDDPARLVERLARMRALTDAVLALPPPYRDAIVRRHLEELSPAEIARRDGVPVATIETRLKRARKQLRERLETSYGIGRDALALLVTGVKAGATWKAATLAAAAIVAFAGAATWRVVAAMRAPETAASSVGANDVAASEDISPREVDDNPLVAKVSAVDPRLEWPDEATLRRMEQRGRALFGGIVRAPDGTPCVGATVSFDGDLVATTDVRGAWRADVLFASVDEESGIERGPGSAREFVARKEHVGSAATYVLLPSRRIDLVLETGLSFSGTVVDFDEGTPIDGAELELSQYDGSTHRLMLHARADALGRFEFLHLREGSVYVKGHAPGYDSNGFMGYDFSRGRDMVVAYRLRKQYALRGRFVPWPVPGVAAERATVKLTTQSPHDSTNTKHDTEGVIAPDGRFELPLSVCPRCWVELDVGGEPFWKEEIDTNEERRGFDIDDVRLAPASSFTGRFDVTVGDVPPRASVVATITLQNGLGMNLCAPIGADGAFRLAPLPPGQADLFLGLGRSRIAALEIESENGDAQLAAGDVEIVAGTKRDFGRVTSRATLLHGVLRDSDGVPVAFALVNESRRLASGNRPVPFTAVADVDGRFVLARDLTGLEDADVRELEGNARWSVQNCGWGETREAFEWPSSRAFVRHDVVLGDGVTFSGRIVDDSDRPIKEAEIWASSTDGIERAFGSDRSREDGSFEIRGMQPGAYRVFVADEDGATHFDGIHPENGPVTLRLARPKKE